MMDAQYDIEEWAAETTRGRHIFNYNYRMMGDEIRDWEMINSATMESEPGVTERIYLWQKKGSKGQASVRISIVELPHWRSAQNLLLNQLRHSMRPNIPKGSGKFAQTGDIRFVGQEEQSGVVATIFFTRGNIFLSVSSVGEKVVDVSGMAKNLDRNFSGPPKEEEVKKGLVEVLSPKPLSVKEKEKTILIEKLPEPVPRSGWLKIIAPDGELSREDDALFYVSSKAGKKQIGKYVMVQRGQ